MIKKDIKELETEIIGATEFTKYEDVKNIKTEEYFNNNQFSIDAFKKKYALIDNPDETYVQALKRVCDFVASVEKTEELKNYWAKRWFHEIYNDWFHPAGSIMQGAGSGRKCSLANCTTISLGTGRGSEEWDSLEGIIKNTAYNIAKASAYRQGVGVDFSRIRPEGADVLNSANKSSGAIHWMKFIDSIGNYVGQMGRKPACLISLNCKHPDIEKFVNVKSDRSKIQNANLSVQCTDDFYEAAKNDKNWELSFEIPEVKKGQKVYVDFDSITSECKKDDNGWYYLSKSNRKQETIKKTIKAKELMQLIAKNMYQHAEPGIQNIDIAKKYSNSDYLGDKDYEVFSSNACCLIGESLIITDRGTLSMKEIYDILLKNPKEEILAMSYNIKEDKYEFKRILSSWQKRNDATVELEIEEDGIIYKIECSSDHPIMTKNRGYVQSISLAKDDDIMIFKINEKIGKLLSSKVNPEIKKLYDIEVEDNHNFIANGILVKNSEQYLDRSGSCILSSINCEKFSINYEEREKEFGLIGRSVNRFLDNVNECEIQYYTYASYNQKLSIEKLRRTGAGFTNIAGWLFKQNVAYGTTKSSELMEKFTERYAYYLYKSSIELGHEKGSFGLFNKEKLEKAPFIKRMKKLGLEFDALRNITLVSIAPSGCIHEDTRIMTNRGMLKIKDLIKEKPNEKEFLNMQQEDISVVTENGMSRVKAFYNNGVIDGYVIETADGRKIKTSETHRLRVIDNDGNYIWKYAPEINKGDILVTYLESDEQLFNKIPLVKLDNAIFSNHHNAKEVKLPEKLDEDVAKFVGIFTGDGSIKFKNDRVTPDIIRIPVYIEDYDFIETINTLTNKIFGTGCVTKTCKDKEMHEVSLYSTNIGRFMIANGFSKKDKATDVEHKNSHVYHVPEKIFHSPPSVIGSYLSGLFETDGSVSGANVSFSSKFLHVVEEVQELLIMLGIQSRIKEIDRSEDPTAFNDKIYTLNIKYIKDVVLFREKVGFLSERKKRVLDCVEYTLDMEPIYISYKDAVLARKAIAKRNGWKTKLWARLNTAIWTSRKNEASIVRVTKNTYKELLEYCDIGKIKFNFATTLVKHVSKDKFQTYDIEVDDFSHSYITSNGFINHNTVSLMFRDLVMSYGIEPAFGLYYWKRTRMSGKYEYYFNVPHIVRESFKKANLIVPIDSDTIKDDWQGTKGKKIAEFIDVNKSKLGIEFKCATDINCKDKLEMMAKINKWVDSSISVTYMLPETAKWEEVYDFIMLAHEKEVKSISVYTDTKMYGVISFTPFKDLALKLKNENVYMHPQNFDADELKALNMTTGDVVLNTKNAPKRPQVLDADIYSVTVNKERFVIVIGKYNGYPYEVFGGKMNGLKLDLESKHVEGKIIKVSRGVYALEFEQAYIKDFSKQFTPVEKSMFRSFSLMLRHGIPIEHIVEQLNKGEENMFSVSSAIVRVLKKYIKNGQKVSGNSCPNCGGTLLYFDGCVQCSCGYSACS